MEKPSKLSLEKINKIITVKGTPIESPTPRSYTNQADQMNEEIRQIKIQDAKDAAELEMYECRP
ncbi:MAG: hypothetical protein PHE32_02790 [Candidatus Shapirobacteria bacterium]|nr:hypothetical protein [Candidatus Shapirobacteria bacterium]MDD4410600.1 hypothetical protein [Candidatus Shapirobacteria bacterium]